MDLIQKLNQSQVESHSDLQGPLLFLIYINGFIYSLSKTECGHFADDSYISLASKNIKTIETVMSYELKLWMKLNKLSLNKDKTKLIIFHSRFKSINANISIKLDKFKLVPVDHVKYLGIYLDNHLSWGFHINQLSKTLSQANGILAKLRHNAPQNSTTGIPCYLLLSPKLWVFYLGPLL